MNSKLEKLIAGDPIDALVKQLVYGTSMETVQPTPQDYKREREKRGTQVQVAAMLGVHPITIAKRETGAPDGPITREAWLALLSLPVRDSG